MKIFAAPLQGFTDYVWRNAHRMVYGDCIWRYYSPFMRLEKGNFRKRDLRDISMDNNAEDVKLVPQVLACASADAVKIVAKIVEMGYEEVDVNLGCPFPPVTRKHQGAGMLPYVDEVADLFKALATMTGVRYSVKMRLGMESADEWTGILPLLDILYPAHVSVHPRTARQQYGGEIDYKQFAKFYSLSKWPVVYNGDVRSADDVTRVESSFPGLHGIMIGRGLLMEPGLSLNDYSIEMKKRFYDHLFSGYSKIYDEHQLVLKMHAFWEYFMSGEDRRLRKKILKSRNLSDYEVAVKAFWMAMGAI